MTTGNPNDERRQFERKPFEIEIEYEGGALRGTATTRDIGLGGLYMATDKKFALHSPLRLRLRLSEQDLEINGVVVYEEEGEGVGIRFQNLSPEAEEILRRELPAIETANVTVKRR